MITSMIRNKTVKKLHLAREIARKAGRSNNGDEQEQD